jgi:hypothetical protein
VETQSVRGIFNKNINFNRLLGEGFGSHGLFGLGLNEDYVANKCSWPFV